MIVEFGNTQAHREIDSQPKVTSIHIPEADEHGLGGYSHKPGAITPQEFRQHYSDAMTHRNGVTSLPDHEALLAIHTAWPTQSPAAPTWVKVHPHDLTPDGHAEDIEQFLAELYRCDVASEDVLLTKEDRHWTRFGAPGDGGPVLPELKAMLTNDGRVQQAQNYGGGQVGASGTGTAATATSFTTGATMLLNAWSGYRVYVNGVWANVISNTTTGVLTVDRWYNPATPGGAAATTPSSFGYILADGGGVSAWFMGLSTSNPNVTPLAATDHALYGEYTTAGGGCLRKIAPYALTYGTSPMTFTLAPVWTSNSSDTFPSNFYSAAAFNSMVVSNTVLAMKFESIMVASTTIAAAGNQVLITETIQGS